MVTFLHPYCPTLDPFWEPVQDDQDLERDLKILWNVKSLRKNRRQTDGQTIGAHYTTLEHSAQIHLKLLYAHSRYPF